MPPPILAIGFPIVFHTLRLDVLQHMVNRRLEQRGVVFVQRRPEIDDSAVTRAVGRVQAVPTGLQDCRIGFLIFAATHQRLLRQIRMNRLDRQAIQDRVEVTGLRPSSLPHHRTCGLPYPACENMRIGKILFPGSIC